MAQTSAERKVLQVTFLAQPEFKNMYNAAFEPASAVLRDKTYPHAKSLAGKTKEVGAIRATAISAVWAYQKKMSTEDKEQYRLILENTDKDIASVEAALLKCRSVV